MVRVKAPGRGGKWIDVNPPNPNGHMQRVDGSQLTPDDLERVVSVVPLREQGSYDPELMAVNAAIREADKPERAKPPKVPATLATLEAAIEKGHAMIGTNSLRQNGRGKTRLNPEAAWWLIVTEGKSQVEVAKQFGITQSGVQRHLDVYMQEHGISGPRPGLLKPKEKPVSSEPPDPFREPEPIGERVDYRDAKVRVTDPPQTAKEAMDVGREVQALARAGQLSGLDPLEMELLERGLHPWLYGSVLWLIENGDKATPGQISAWIAAFGQGVRLVYRR